MHQMAFIEIASLSLFLKVDETWSSGLQVQKDGWLMQRYIKVMR